MNTSVLSGLAAALKGGLAGYNAGQDRQRQAALDALQAKKIEQDDSLRQAALDAKMRSDEARLKLQGDLAAEKERALSLKTQDAERSAWREKWGVGNDPDFVDLRGEYFTAGEDALKAPEGAEREAIRTRGQDTLKRASERQAKLRADKQAAELKKAEASAAARKEIKENPGPKKDLGPSELKEVRDKSKALDANRQNIGLVVKSVPRNMWDKKINQVSKYFAAQDPETALVLSGIDRSYLADRQALTGAAASQQEDSFIRASMPNTDDDFKTFLAKAWIYQKVGEYQRARTLNEMAQVREMRDMPVPPMPPEPWTLYRGVDAAIAELTGQYAPPANAPSGGSKYDAGPGAKPAGGF